METVNPSRNLVWVRPNADLSKTLAGRRDAAGGCATKLHWAKRFKPYTLVTPSRRSCRPVIVILPYLVSGRVDWHEDEFGCFPLAEAFWAASVF